MKRSADKNARLKMLETGIADIENTSYTVDVSYPLHIFREPEDPSVSLRKMARTLGGKDIGSGAGMGRRDIAFAFKTFIEALAFVGDIERAKNPFVRIEAMFMDTNDPDYETVPLNY